MLQAGRSKNAGGYRFGFQGQEADNKIGGLGQHLNYTFRNYDSWIIRFGAIDPLAGKYPYWSPFAFSGNRVIDAVELEGLEPARVRLNALNNDTAPESGGISNSETLKKQYDTKLTNQLKSPLVALMLIGLSSVGNGLYGSSYDPWAVLKLTETEKRKIFNESTNKTIAILMSEFVEGTGMENRYFGSNTPISNDIKHSYTTQLFLDQFVYGYQNGLYTEGEEYSTTVFTSPDITNQNGLGISLSSNPNKIALKALGQGVWNTAAFYTGSLDYSFEITGNTLSVTVHNQYSIASGVTRNDSDNLSRIPGYTSRLGNTNQFFNFSINITDFITVSLPLCNRE